MIDYIKGEVAELTPTTVTVETYGVGYSLSISLNTYSSLSGKKEVKLYVHEAIREDAYQLYGFFDKYEREIFRQLISVSGVGPSTGRMFLSSMTPEELAQSIASGDVNVLKTVKGIGVKTAQRLIVELKDKIHTDGIGELPMVGATHPVSEEAVAALVMLGFVQKTSEKVVVQIVKENPAISVEQTIKKALKML